MLLQQIARHEQRWRVFRIFDSFRILLDQEYTRARRLLEIHSDLLPATSEPEAPSTNGDKSLVGGQVEQVRSGGNEAEPPELPV